MVFSSVVAIFLSLAALSASRPVSGGLEVQPEKLEVQPEQLEVMFSAGVEAYLRTHPPVPADELSHPIENNFAIQACEGVYLVFARGTFEPGGTRDMGDMVGSQFDRALRQALGDRYDGIGVDYNNGVAGYLSGGDSAGAYKMAQMITSKVKSCPSTKIVAGGYSQGAQLVHKALGQLSGDIKRMVAAVVVFGDPNKGRAISGISSDKIYTNCASDDPICNGIPFPIGSHLLYGGESDKLRQIAQFVKSHV